MTDLEGAVELRLSPYDVQVLLGTSIAGCNMSPDRVFDLKLAWQSLYSAGLIDRVDGLACPTKEGEAAIDAILSTLSPSPDTPAPGSFDVQPIGYARQIDVEWAERPFEGRTSFWCHESQNAYYSVPVYTSPANPAETQAVDEVGECKATFVSANVIPRGKVETE